MKKIAILIPCYNEAQTIAAVVHDFKQQLPDADVFVYDNNSTDKTAEEAVHAGAIVRCEPRQGKGNVVRSMFRQIDADIYVMVDGDGTYPANKVRELIRPIAEDEADMVVASRLHAKSESRFRFLNLLGNRFYLVILNNIFRMNLTDLLSGYRAFSRRVVKNLPILSRGFEIETELTVRSLERRYRLAEIPINLAPRPAGSASKIRILRDGFLILNTMFALFRDYKPLTAFGLLGLLLMAAGLVPGLAELSGYLTTGTVVSLPAVIVSVGMVLSGLLVAFVGLVLHTLSRRFQELEYQLQNLLDEHKG